MHKFPKYSGEKTAVKWGEKWHQQSKSNEDSYPHPLGSQKPLQKNFIHQSTTLQLTFHGQWQRHKNKWPASSAMSKPKPQKFKSTVILGGNSTATAGGIHIGTRTYGESMFHHRKRKEIADVSGYFWVGFHVTKSSKRLSEKFMLSFVTYILIPSLVVQLFYTKLQLYRLKLVSLQTKMSHNSLPRKKKKTSLLRFVWKAY